MTIIFLHPSSALFIPRRLGVSLGINLLPEDGKSLLVRLHLLRMRL